MKATKEFWNQQHDAYAQTDWITKPSRFAQWAIEFFPQAGTILELGAGHGFDSIFFASKGYQVISTDFSENARVYIKKHLGHQDKSNIVIENLDLSKPFRYKEGSFDIVYSHLSIHYFTDEVTKQLFDEIYRVLKPGGVVALLANSTSDPEYNTGEKIEEDYFRIDALYKRYFSVESMRKYAQQFEEIVCDNQGTTYKDEAIGVHNLIRFVGKKQ
jgi:SAM-dependent methyltransferase